MSSTFRGSARAEADYYATPQDVVEKMLDALCGIMPFRPKSMLDPAAGGNREDGERYRAAMPYPEAFCRRFPGIGIDTMDIRRDSLAEHRGTDFLGVEPSAWGKRYDVVATNPPFSLAEEFIRHSFGFLSERGVVVMLLRLNFLEGMKRKPFFDEFMPTYIFVHRKRIGFNHNRKTGRKGTDSVAYAHYVWLPPDAVRQNHSTLFII